MSDESRIVHASREIAAPAATIFELIADPARQPEWDGNHNLGHADAGQRITAVGQVFTMHNQGGAIRDNHVVDFVEGRRIAWRPGVQGGPPIGHEWRWQLEPVDDDHTLVTHTYNWTDLTDPSRLTRARGTTADKLRASLDRLAAVAEG
jgi:uncharacterized protein YndB with AHSA1/START domain